MSNATADAAALRWLDRQLPPEIRDDPRLRRRGRLIVVSSHGLVLAIAFGCIGRLLFGPMTPLVLASYILALPCLVSIPILLRRTGSLALAGALTTCVLLLVVLAAVVFGGGLDGNSLVLLPLVPLLGTYLVGVRAGFVLTLLPSLAIWLLMAAVYLGVDFEQPPIEGTTIPLTRGLVAFFAVLLTGGIAISAERERRTAKRAHFRSRELYRRLFEQSKDIVAMATPGGQLLDLNQSGLDFFGLDSREEIGGLKVADLYDNPEDREELLARLQRDGYLSSYESCMRGAGGERRWVSGTTSVIRDEDSGTTYFMGILRDVTAEKLLAEEAREIMHQLERSNAELERFVYSVTHDLKSPLFTIISALDLMEEDLEAGNLEEAAELREQALKAGERMQGLIEDLLTLSRLGSGHRPMTEVDLGALGMEVGEMLAGRVRETGVTLRIDEDLPTVRGEPTLLRALVQNLVDNAIKYTGMELARRRSEEGGSDGAEVRLGWERRDGEPVFFVEDRGPGIAEADRERVFELFEQLDPEQAGTGAGLAIARKVVETHGGRIWVEGPRSGDEGAAADHAGATFVFTLQG